MEKDIKVQDLQQYCRTCLNEFVGFKHVIDQMPRNIFQLFKQVAGYKKSDKNLYPNWVCDPCCEKIKSFDEFRVLSKKSTQFLEELLNSYKPTDETSDIDSEVNKQAEDSLLEAISNNDKDTEEIEIDKVENNFEEIFFDMEIKEEQHENEQPILTSLDSLTLPNDETIVKIEESNKNSNENTTCQICDLTYSNASVLKAHMRIHQDLRPFPCQKCNRGFNKKCHLKRHIEDVHAEVPIEIICKYGCGKVFTKTQTAASHYRYKHSTDVVVCEETPSMPIKNKQNSLKNSDDDSSDDNLDLLFMSKTTCKICHRTLSSLSALKNHLRVHEDKRPFQCEKCERGFNKKSRLKEHIQETHAEKPLEIPCKFACGKIFLRTQTAAAHYRKYHTTNTSNKIEETKTNENLLTNDGDQQEQISGVEKETSKLTCKICLQIYSSVQTLRVHQRLHRDTRPFQCDKCERSFNKRARLNRHIAEYHADKPLEIPCKFGCGKVFRHYETATNHFYLKHILPEKGIKPKETSFVCEDCGRVFKSLATLREHSYQHRPPEDRPFKCAQCSKSFVSKRTYEDHLLRHSGIKNFECPHCGIKKTTRRELRTHVNCHTKDKKYICPVCSKVFNRPENLRLHRRTVHDGIRRFKCRYCDQAFGKSDTLKHHEMRHTGEKPHKCSFCDRSFIQAVALRTHLNTHNK